MFSAVSKPVSCFTAHLGFDGATLAAMDETVNIWRLRRLGRTLKEVIEAGCTHVFLEKPGAPTVKELEEMKEYAKEKGGEQSCAQTRP